MKYSSLIFAIYLVVFTITPGGYSLFGVDLGGQDIKSCYLGSGKNLFNIVEDTSGKRKTSNVVGFFNQKRSFEREAVMRKNRDPETIFTFPLQFLGKINHENETEHPYTFVNTSRDTFAFSLADFSTSKIKEANSTSQMNVTVEEAIAMILSHIHGNAKDQSQKSMKDVVITVPPYADFAYRQALKDSLQLANLNPLAFIGENTAAALYHGIQRLDNQTYRVLYYNLGSTSLKVSIVEYHKINNTGKQKSQFKEIESVTVLAEAWDETVNGQLFTIRLAELIADRFDAQPSREGKPSIRENLNKWLKLVQASQKKKEQLSAGKEARLFFEFLDEFQLKITQNEYNEQCSDLFEKILQPIEAVLQKANQTLSDIHSFEAIGGAWRMPRIKEILKKNIGELEISTHLNSYEAMAMGAAFHGANFSSLFRARPILLSDGLNVDVNLVIQTLNETRGEIVEVNTTNITEEESENLEEIEKLVVNQFHKELVLVKIKERFMTKKKFTFTYNGDLEFILTYTDQYGVKKPYKIIEFTDINTISEDPKYREYGAPKLTIKFLLNTLGLVEVDTAFATFEQVVEVNYTERVRVEDNQTTPEEGNATIEEGNATIEEANATIEEGNVTIDEENLTELAQDDERIEENNEIEQNETNSTLNEETNSTLDEETNSTLNETFKLKFKNVKRLKYETVNKTRNETKTYKVDLKYETYYVGSLRPMSSIEIKDSKKKLKRHDKYSRWLKLQAEAKNSLESLIYSTTSKIEDEEFQKVTTEEQREELRKLAEEYDDWLYTDEADVADIPEINKKIDSITDIVQPAMSRLKEFEIRPDMIASAYDYLDYFYNQSTNETVINEWITENDTLQIQTFINETADWLSQKVTDQQELPMYLDPILKRSEIGDKLEIVKEKFGKYLKIPDPNKKKEKKSPVERDAEYREWLKKLKKDNRTMYDEYMDMYNDTNGTNGTNETFEDDFDIGFSNYSNETFEDNETILDEEIIGDFSQDEEIQDGDL